MGLLAGIFWVILGVLYIVYKLGEEKSGAGKAGGLGCVLVFVLFFALFVSIIEYSMDFAVLLFCVGILGFVVYVVAAGIRQVKTDDIKKKEQFEIGIIQGDLPLPTQSQMDEFIEDILSTKDPSPLQMEYRQMYRKARANITTETLDANHFLYMQAAWIYYSRTGADSPERRRIFGHQYLPSKTYFDPSVNRSEEPKIVNYTEAFEGATEKLSVKISPQWMEQPRFFENVASMVDKSTPLTEETLYPLMLKFRVNAQQWEFLWMDDEIRAVRSALYPKVSYVASPLPMRNPQVEEWLKVDAFFVVCLTAVREKRSLTSEEIFPKMLRLYNSLVKEKFTSGKYDFTLLWHGLDAVGRSIGMGGSFFDYPRFLPDSSILPTGKGGDS